MAIHAICNLDKIMSIYNGNLESVKPSVDLDNGSVAVITGFVSGEKELKTITTPETATLASDEIVLIASPEVNYLPATHLQDFYNQANMPARAYHLHAGDIFTVSDMNLGGTTVVGQWVAPADGSYKLTAETALPTTRFVGLVLEKGTQGYYKQPCTTIQVLKA